MDAPLPIVLAPFAPADLDEIVALQHRHAPAHERWTREDARMELCDAGRGHGQNTLVARVRGAVSGAVGWVDLAAGAGEFYAAPLLAADPDTAALLLARVLERARRSGAAWIRVGLAAGDEIKRRALEQAGFARALEFIHLVRRVDAAPEPPPVIAGLRPVERRDIDPHRFADLHNTCFRDVPNAPAIGPEIAREAWDDDRVWPEASMLLADAEGRYQAFVLCRRDGFIDEIGVAPAMQRRGLARALLHRVIAVAAAAQVPALRCLCAATNEPSLALHRSLGFVEVSRRAIWQRDL